MKTKLKELFGLICSILPKKNIILFESHSDFTDSSKALYEKILYEKKCLKYKLVWVVDEPANFEKHYNDRTIFIYKHPKKIYNKIEKLYYFVFSKICFYTHDLIGLPYNKGQIIYFLNHSSFPIKDVRGCYCNPNYNTYIEVTSHKSLKYRTIALGGGENKMKIFGLPRNDFLFKPNRYLKKLNIAPDNKIIIWMPTFKHIKNSTRNDFKSNEIKDISLITKENLTLINDILKSKKAYLIIKYHPAQDMRYVEKFEFSNIIFLTNEELEKNNIELYKLLGASDALITDFSSVFFDYLLVDKPIGFELCDKEKYEQGRGFLVENPLDYMPGDRIYNIEQLLNFIISICNNQDKYKKERKKILNEIHDFKDGKSSERILEFLNII